MKKWGLVFPVVFVVGLVVGVVVGRVVHEGQVEQAVQQDGESESLSYENIAVISWICVFLNH